MSPSEFHWAFPGYFFMPIEKKTYQHTYRRGEGMHVPLEPVWWKAQATLHPGNCSEMKIDGKI